MSASLGLCLHLSRILCGFYLSFWVFSVGLGFHLLPPPCSSIWLPCCRSPGSTSFCCLEFFFRVVPPWLLLLAFLVVVSFQGSGLLSPSPILGLPLALEGLSLLTQSNLRFPPRWGPPFGLSQLLLGFFALLLVRLSFAHLSTFSMSASSCFYTARFPVCGPSFVIILSLEVFLPSPSCCRSPSWVCCQCCFFIRCFPREVFP